MALLSTFGILATLALLSASPPQAVGEGPQAKLKILPVPRSLESLTGAIELLPDSRILFDVREVHRPVERSLKAHAGVLSEELELLTGHRLNVVALSDVEPKPGDIVLRFRELEGPLARSEETEDQSYLLQVQKWALVESRYTKGIAYGTATLLQALQLEPDRASLPRMVVQDAPHAEYRTVMVDIARRRHRIATLKDVVRLARLYKVRYLHLHLTDDQNFVFPFEPVTDNVTGNYTISREKLKDLVRYADARGVTIIPELDLPGHSTVLRNSGYLDPSETDADVAHPDNADKIHAIVDDMLSVFDTSPYFHIGGDESAAGSALNPFLRRVNRHLYDGRPFADPVRLIVWEGFHGAPNGLPTTGPERILVLSWESSYNPPWALLEAGYTIANASWKPLYLVGRGTPRHPGASTRMWSPETLFTWDKNTFMHWEPGRPVFEDAGPEDPNDDDGTWSAAYIGREDQVIGGQMLLWEQEEQWVTEDLSTRLPVMAARLWNPEAPTTFDDFERIAEDVRRRVRTIVRPVEILPLSNDPESPVSLDFRLYEGESLEVSLHNKSRIRGQLRYNVGSVSDDLTWIVSNPIPQVNAGSTLYQGPFTLEGGFGIRARLFREDGTPVDGTDWQAFQNWPQRVRITDYDFGRHALDEPPNTDLHADKVTATYVLPMLRGPYTHVDARVQKQEATVRIEQGGTYILSAKTQSGRANVFLDTNQDGQIDVDTELQIENTPTTEEVISTTLELAAGTYLLRADHACALPRPVIVVYLEGPDTGGVRREISPFLVPLK